MSQKPRIALCVPSRGEWKACTARCYAAMCMKFAAEYVGTGQADVIQLQDMGTLLPFMRESLVKAARQAGATHILWIDDDMTFPPDALERLLNHGVPIVGAGYSQRRPPCRPTTMKQGVWVYTDEDKTGLEAVSFLGMGLMLTEVSVFENITEPFFDLQRIEGGSWIGEDVYFCLKARHELSIDVFIDHDLTKEVGHVGEHVYEMADAIRDRPIIEKEIEAKRRGEPFENPYKLLPHDKALLKRLGKTIHDLDGGDANIVVNRTAAE